MTTAYILIIFASYTAAYNDVQWGAVATAEFADEQSCIKAVDAFRTLRQSVNQWSKAAAVCVPKATQPEQ